MTDKPLSTSAWTPRVALALLLASALTTVHGEPALSGAFLSAGLTEALRNLANTTDTGPPILGSGSNSGFNSSGFPAPKLWSVELFGASGDGGQPTVLRSSDDGSFAEFAASDAADGSDPSHVHVVFASASGPVPPVLTFDLRSADGAPLTVGAYADATATVTPGAPQLDIFYNVDSCHADQRGFVIDDIAFYAGQLSRLTAHFHCGASFSGVLRFDKTAATADDVVRITGVVWQDHNGDGLRDYNDTDGTGVDAPLGGVRVNLRKQGRRVASAVSKADGSYGFSAPLADYQLEVVPPAGMKATARITDGASAVDPDTGLSDEVASGPADTEMVVFASMFPPNTVLPATVGHVARPPALPIGLTLIGGRPSLPLASTRLAPLAAGDRARYSMYDGSATTFATEVVLPRPQLLNGSLTFDVEDVDTSHIALSNDAQGLRLHHASILLANGRRSEMDFVPPMVLLPGQVDLVPHASSGRAFVRNAAGLTTTLRYMLNTHFSAGFAGVPEAVKDLDASFGGGRGVEASSTLSFSGRINVTQVATTTRGFDVYRLDDGLAYSRLPGERRQHDLYGRQRGFGDSFDANRRSDVVAWNAATGRAGVWRMAGAAAALWQDLPAASSGAATTVKGDFNGDGRLDIATHEVDSGLVSVRDQSTLPVPMAFAPPGSELVGRGSFSAYGKSFLLWRTPGHPGLGHWSFEGGPSQIHVVSDLVDASNTALSTPPGARLVGSGDFDADGSEELLWEDVTNGRCEMWFINFAMRMRVAFVPLPAPWRVAALDDFDGDGRADILLFNTRTREVRLRLMQGKKVTTDRIIAVADVGTRIVDSGDYNGDGAADLLWRKGAGGALRVWLLRGTSVLSRGVAQALPAGFNPLP